MECIVFRGSVQAEYRQAVLTSLGKQLKRIYFVGCKDIDWTELSPCFGLKMLYLNPHCKLKPTTAAAVLGDDFLPCLEDFSCFLCLGTSSAWLETPRLSMKEIFLCAYFDVRPASNFRWEDVPFLWPNLQKLNLQNAKGLTLEKLLHIIPQFPRLNDIFLPEDFLNLETKNQLAAELDQKFPHIRLNFRSTDCKFSECCFAQEQKNNEAN